MSEDTLYKELINQWNTDFIKKYKDVSPKDDYTLACLALSQAMYGKKQDARESLKQVSDDPPNQKIRSIVMEAKLFLNDWTDKLPEYEESITRILEMDTTEVFAKAAFAYLRIYQGMYEEGFSILQEIKATYPKSKRIIHYLAETYLSVKQYQQALKYINEMDASIVRSVYYFLVKFYYPYAKIWGWVILILLLLPKIYLPIYIVIFVICVFGYFYFQREKFYIISGFFKLMLQFSTIWFLVGFAVYEIIIAMITGSLPFPLEY
jgi:tetratricopeptide (TPR) repeat protein